MSTQVQEGAARYQAQPVTADAKQGTLDFQAGDFHAESSHTNARTSASHLITEHLDLWTSTITHKSSRGRGRGNGKRSKIELTGITKLRELILELAVRGKLVAQSPEDEPASKLLERIEAEKAQLIKDGKLKKQKPLSPVSEDEKPFELPANWSWTRFGQICQHNSGKTLDSSRNSGTLRPYITTSNLYWGFFQLSEVREMPISDTELDKCQAVEGDLLICEGGEAGRAAVWESVNPVCFQNHIHRARPFGKLSPYYLFRLFQRLDLSGEIANYRKGVAISNMSGKALASIPVPLPPLIEQQRITAKVDELMALCDQLEQKSEHQLSAHQQLTDTLLATLTDSADAQELNDNWQRLAQHFDLLFSGPMGAWAIDRLKDTILQLAVMGKLVPQNAEDEPASKLLQRIEEEKARLVKEGKIKKPKKLPPVGDEEKPFKLPQGWEWVQLNDVTKDLKYGTSKKCDYSARNTAVLRIPNVVSGVIDLEDIKYTDMSDKELHDLTLSSGDLLFIRSNGSTDIVGRCAVIEKDLPGYAYAGYLVRCRAFSNSISSIYLKKCMDSSNTRAQIELPIRTTSGVKNINSTELSRITFPLPPLAEQHRIVAKVDELFALCDQLKARLQQASETEQYFTNTIVEQALN